MDKLIEYHGLHLTQEMIGAIEIDNDIISILRLETHEDIAPLNRPATSHGTSSQKATQAPLKPLSEL